MNDEERGAVIAFVIIGISWFAMEFLEVTV